MSEHDFGWREVNVVDSGRRLVEEEKLIGYCRFDKHSGYLTAKVLNKHKCLQKNCKLLVKFLENEYWQRRDKHKNKAENQLSQDNMKEEQKTAVETPSAKGVNPAEKIMNSADNAAAKQESKINYGDIFMARLPVINNSHIQYGTRPALIVSNDICNKNAEIVTVIPFTTTMRIYLPTHVAVQGYGLEKPSVLLCEHIMPIDKGRLDKHIGKIADNKLIRQIERAILTQINMSDYKKRLPRTKSSKPTQPEKAELDDKSLLWLGRIHACNRYSGSKREWCDKNGVSYKTLMNRQTGFKKAGLL